MTKDYQNELLCSSCGVELQSNDPNGDGYWVSPENRPNHADRREKNGLAVAKELLLMSHLRDVESPLLREKEPKQERPTCQKCLDILHRSQFDLNKQSFTTVDEVMATIPEDAHLVHVVSALDFPLSVSRTVTEGRNPAKIWYIVTKADAFFSKVGQLKETGLPYFQRSLQKLVGADPSHVSLVSGKLGWETESLLSRLPPGKLYFVGGVNSGKSTLVRTLIYRDDKSLRNSDRYGPGISEVPGFTSGHLQYPLKGSTAVLIDTPGYAPVNRGVYQYLLPEDVKKVAKVTKYASAERYGHAVKSPDIDNKLFSGASLYSVGGLFYLQPPKDAVLRVFVNVPGEQAKYRDMERLLKVNDTRSDALGHRFIVSPAAAHNLERYVIPPFMGKIDVVLRNVGFVTIAPTSRLTDQLYQIYVPKGIDVAIRESIFNYIYKAPGPRDSYGHRLDKKDITVRGAKRLRQVPQQKPIFSSLYAVPLDSTSDQISDAIPGTNWSTKCRLQEKYSNDYWREPPLP